MRRLDLQQTLARLIEPEPNTGCWLWAGLLNPGGYGVLVIQDAKALGEKAAHRITWTVHRGRIPDGLVVDHLCRVRSCVNPDHLRVVTPRVNALENNLSPPAQSAARSHCIYGHSLDDAYLYRQATTGRRRRCCRPCANARAAKQRAVRRALCS